MRLLTKKEEVIMSHFWNHGAMFVRVLRLLYSDPLPHFNTLSGQVRTLESDGFVSHISYGPVFKYYPIVDRQTYNSYVLNNVVDKFFGNSYVHVVSSFVSDEKISLEELKALISQFE